MLLMISVKFLNKNKKQSFTMLMGIILSSILLFSIGILFSSFRNFMIEDVEENIGNYHVKIVGNITDVNKKEILSIKKRNEYYIRFKDVKKVYDYTNSICSKNKCLKIIYNNKLLSLYGISDDENLLNIFNKLITLIILILSLSVFFIIYNSFNISLIKQKKDIFLFKISGASNKDLYKLYFFQDIIIGTVGVIIGFLISIFLNVFLIKLINVFLYEFFKDNLKFSIYVDFILIPLLFISLIIVLSSLLPLRNLRKYRIINFYNPIKNTYTNKYDLSKNFLINYALTNYERERHNYKNLIICLFILFILFNSLFVFMKYTFKIINDYVMIPEYDLSVSGDNQVIENISKKLNYSKATIFNSCNGIVQIPKKNFNKNYQENLNALITNLGGNEVINVVSEINYKNDLIIKNNYSPFSKLEKIILNGETISVDLTKQIPFGFNGLLKSDMIILKLDDDNFSKFCLNYETVAYFKTDKERLDLFLNKYALKNKVELSYSNVKKAKQLIRNITLLVKLFVCLIMILIVLICVTTIFNVIFVNISFKKRELANLKVLGLRNYEIFKILCLESLIITAKAFIYALPFVLFIFKFLYINLGKVFKVNLFVFDYKLLFLSFVLYLFIVVTCMLLSYLSLRKRSLIINIKRYYSAIKETNFDWFVFLHEKTRQIMTCLDIFL